MLVEFSVQNFRSIHQRQTLSLVASKDKTFRDTHTIETKVSAVPHVLRSAGMYGANGSGKTNLLHALGYFQWFVKSCFSRSPEEPTALVSFAFQDEEGRQSPAEFEVTLLLDGVRYQYGFRLDAQRIHEEWLLVYKSQKGQTWFERKYHPDTGKYEFQFSEKLLGAKKVWQESTRPNALFLSTAVQFNSEMLHPVFDWIANKMVFIALFNDAHLFSGYTASRLTDPVFRGRILSFMQGSDISVSDIQLRSDNNRVYFLHRAANRDAFLDLADESLGIQRLFALTGPVLNVLEQGLLLVVDELESSLHPLLVQRLVELFHDPKVNTKGAQLVFTTHNTFLFDQSMFRRDQIWLVEKNTQQATELIPLTEFQIRKDLVLDKAYLEGRFGAIPIFSDLKEV